MNNITFEKIFSKTMRLTILLIITLFFHISVSSAQPSENWKGPNYVPCKDKNEEATRNAAGKITGKDSGCKSENSSSKQSEGKSCSDLIKEFDEKFKVNKPKDKVAETKAIGSRKDASTFLSMKKEDNCKKSISFSLSTLDPNYGVNPDAQKILKNSPLELK